MQDTGIGALAEVDEDLVPPDARAVLRINLKALRENWARLNAETGSAECAGVIKADAYGLGLEQIAHALTREGCRTFFVTTLEEGRQARTVQPGAIIYVLDGLIPRAEEYYSGFDLRPVLSSLAEVQDWARYCTRLNRRFPAAVHIDTGINRLGMPEAEIEQIFRAPGMLAPFDVSLVLSHLACADDAASPKNAEQRRRFDALRLKLPRAMVSLANSGGVFLGPEYHYDMVRPGIALYGGRALEGRPNPMRPVVKLLARILQVREVPRGETVGYGAIWKVDQPARIATIAVGYADGFLRALSGPSGHPGPIGYIGDYPVPVVGRVSMDLVTVDVSSVPLPLAQRGGWVEVIGDRVSVDDLTDRAGTIGYELLSRLSRRVHRIYDGSEC
jgi:alanine racemase